MQLATTQSQSIDMNACKHMVLEDFIRDYKIDSVQHHVAHLLRRWRKEGKLAGEFGQPIAVRQGRQWYVMDPDAVYRLYENRKRPIETLTISGQWRRKKKEQEDQAQAARRLIKNYARRHNLSAPDIRNTPLLFEAAALEQEVLDGNLTLEQARRRFMRAFPETSKLGKRYVAHYIGKCNGGCLGKEGEKECPYQDRRDLASLIVQ